MMMVKGGMRVVSYGRVSRVLGPAGDSFLSPREQRDRIAQWASDHGATIVEHLEDLDVSGGTIDRPGFQRALALIEAGEADVLVTARLDRFARSIPLAYQAIERLEAAGGTFV